MYRHKPNFNQVSYAQMYHKAYDKAELGDLLFFKPAEGKAHMQSDYSFRLITGELEANDTEPRRLWVINLAIGLSGTGRSKRFFLEREITFKRQSSYHSSDLEVEVINNYSIIKTLWYDHNYKVPPSKLKEVMGDTLLEELWLLLDMASGGR